jgi:hypothetical protein
MTNEVRQVETEESLEDLAAESAEARSIFRAAEAIAQARAVTINDVLARYGVGYRIYASEPKLVDAAVALAEAQCEAHKHEKAMPADRDALRSVSCTERVILSNAEGGFPAAAVERATRELNLTQHHVISVVMAAHAQRMERALVAAVAAYHAVNDDAIKRLGAQTFEAWSPSTELGALLIGGAQ